MMNSCMIPICDRHAGRRKEYSLHIKGTKQTLHIGRYNIRSWSNSQCASKTEGAYVWFYPIWMQLYWNSIYSAKLIQFYV